MAVFHQMGYQSDNLLEAPELSGYSGAVLSPVNYTQSEITALVNRVGSRSSFETIFDPQLYYPNSERGKLRTWSYFPSDVDTADLTSDAWWDSLLDALVAECAQCGPTSLCSPAVVPRQYNSAYFAALVNVGNRLASRLQSTSISFLQTAVVSLADLSAPSRAMEVASILSRTTAPRVYLVLEGLMDPRRELSDDAELKGAMRLIAELEAAGLRVFTAFTSSDLVLWKSAGATDCATGKFFNVRRFTRTRFDEPGGGGGQLPYWFEESLLAFLRESDLVRIRAHDAFSDASALNPFGQQILSQIETSPGTAWVGLGWRQFMYWFCDAERRIREGSMDVRAVLKRAEDLWLSFDDISVLMEEPRNNGSWIRAWRRALAEYSMQ